MTACGVTGEVPGSHTTYSVFSLPKPYTSAGENFQERLPKWPINFEEVLLHTRGNFEEPNKVMDSSITTINYCNIINDYYSYNSVINSYY